MAYGKLLHRFNRTLLVKNLLGEHIETANHHTFYLPEFQCFLLEFRLYLSGNHFIVLSGDQNIVVLFGRFWASVPKLEIGYIHCVSDLYSHTDLLLHCLFIHFLDLFWCRWIDLLNFLRNVNWVAYPHPKAQLTVLSRFGLLENKD